MSELFKNTNKNRLYQKVYYLSESLPRKAIEERQDLLDNHERRYLQQQTWLHPECQYFTNLLYKPFLCCKFDLDIACNAITSDCGNDIWQMIEGYVGANV